VFAGSIETHIPSRVHERFEDMSEVAHHRGRITEEYTEPRVHAVRRRRSPASCDTRHLGLKLPSGRFETSVHAASVVRRTRIAHDPSGRTTSPRRSRRHSGALGSRLASMVCDHTYLKMRVSSRRNDGHRCCERRESPEARSFFHWMTDEPRNPRQCSNETSDHPSVDPRRLWRTCAVTDRTTVGQSVRCSRTMPDLPTPGDRH